MFDAIQNSGDKPAINPMAVTRFHDEVQSAPAAKPDSTITVKDSANMVDCGTLPNLLLDEQGKGNADLSGPGGTTADQIITTGKYLMDCPLPDKSPYPFPTSDAQSAPQASLESHATPGPQASHESHAPLGTQEAPKTVVAPAASIDPMSISR